MKYYYYIKADFARSSSRLENLRIAVQYLSEEFKTMFPDNVCTSNSDFLEDITGESYVDCVGITSRSIPLSEFEDITDRMIKDNDQEIVDGLEIKINVHDDNGLITLFYCHQDEWSEYPPDTKNPLVK